MNVWQDAWKTFVAKLSNDERRALLADMGLTVRGFRRNAKTIPPQKVQATLEAAPGARKGSPFFEWFRTRFSGLVNDVESLSDDELGEKQDEILDSYPPEIVTIALAIIRPSLLESWESAIEDKAISLEASQIMERSDRLEGEVADLRGRLDERTGELELSKKEVQALTNENRKLQRRVQDLMDQLAHAKREAEREITRREAETTAARRQIQEKQQQVHDLTAQLERQSRALKGAQTEGAGLRLQINELSAKIEQYRQSRLENEGLFRLYRSLSGHREDDADGASMRILIIGEAFPSQTFDLFGRVVRFETISPPDEIGPEFVDMCKEYDRVMLLSSCPHKVRLGVYQQLGPIVTEIASLSEVRSEIIIEERFG